MARIIIFGHYQNTMKKLLVLLLLSSSVLSGQTLNEMHARSIKAYKRDDFKLFLEWTKRLDSIRPSHPSYTYNLAAAYALNQQPERAIAMLKKSILMDGSTAYEQDKDFVSLHNLAGFQQLTQYKTTVQQPVSSSAKVVSLTEKDLHPEGLCYLTKKKKWLAGSVRKGKIVVFDLKSGECTDWLDTDLPVFALKADEDEKYLWAATSAVPEMEGYDLKWDGRGEVLKIEIKSKTIVARFKTPGKHVFGDLIVARDGAVYVSDSENPVVYKIQDDAMTPWFRLTDRMYNFQGLTCNADQSKIYLADYLSGIVEIPVAAPQAYRFLSMPDGTVEKGIDGLVWFDQSLIAIHNGVKPIRVIRYKLDDSGNIVGFDTIDNNRPEFAEPTLGTVVKDTFYFFGNCPWPAYDMRHQLDRAKLQNPEFYSFRLRN